MPEDKKKLSTTMRIDLIPDVPAESVQGGPRRIIVATPTRKHRRGPMPGEMVGGTPEEAGFNELLQSLYDAALITDMSGQIVDGNVRAVEFLQYSREELTGLSVFDVLLGSNEQLIETLAENLENERFTLISAYCIRKDESYFPAEVAVNKLTRGDLHLCFFLRDITRRRAEEEMLRTCFAAIQNSGNGIAVANLDAKLEYANPALAEMWGYGETEKLLGLDVRDLLASREEAERLLEAVAESSDTMVLETKGAKLDRTEFQVQASAACNRNNDGEAVGFVLSFVDIADRKRAEGAEREAERHRVMLESLGAACHHLGQPATVLLANLGIIQKRIDDADDLVKELVKTSIDAAETLGEILHKLNTVNEYKTTQYLEKPAGSDSEENRILDI